MGVVIMEDPIFSGSESILWLKIMYGRSNLYREYLVLGTAEFSLSLKETEHHWISLLHILELISKDMCML